MISNNIQKIVRIIDKSKEVRWPSGHVDLERQDFVVNGAKPFVDIQDEIEDAFISCWSVRDYLTHSLTIGEEGRLKKKLIKEIDEEINQYSCLTLCSDVANTIKHKCLDRSRSDQFAYLKLKSMIIVNRSNTNMIHRLDGKYFITPSDNPSECVQLHAHIYSIKGEYLYDAYQCLEDCIHAWGTIEAKLQTENKTSLR